MRTLYETLLDIDDEKNLSKVEYDALWKQLKLEVKGSGKKLRVKWLSLSIDPEGDFTIYVSQLSKHGWDDKKVNAPKLKDIFPEGTVVSVENLSLLSSMYVNNSKGLHISDFLKIGFDPKRIIISSEKDLPFIDTKVNNVELSMLTFDDSIVSALRNKVHYLCWMNYSRYAGDVMKFKAFAMMKDCPFEVVKVHDVMAIFGIDPPKSNLFTINDYLTREDICENGSLTDYFSGRCDEYKKQHCRTVNNMRDWLNNNPNTKLIGNWGKQDELISLDGDKVIATKITQREIEKL